MITQIHHTSLEVADLEARLSIWCDLLGFGIVKRMDESGPYISAMMRLQDVRVTTVKLAASDGNLIELQHFYTHPDQPTWVGTPYSTGFTHIALNINDLDFVCQKLTDTGDIFNTLQQLSPDSYAKVTYGRGPEGVLTDLEEVLRT